MLIYFQLTCIFGNILFSLPCKISSIQWLMIARGLPIGNRRTPHGWEGLCKLCGNLSEKTKHSTSMICLAAAWTYYQALLTILSCHMAPGTLWPLAPSMFLKHSRFSLMGHRSKKIY